MCRDRPPGFRFTLFRYTLGFTPPSPSGTGACVPTLPPFGNSKRPRVLTRLSEPGSPSGHNGAGGRDSCRAALWETAVPGLAFANKFIENATATISAPNAVVRQLDQFVLIVHKSRTRAFYGTMPIDYAAKSPAICCHTPIIPIDVVTIENSRIAVRNRLVTSVFLCSPIKSRRLPR